MGFVFSSLVYGCSSTSIYRYQVYLMPSMLPPLRTQLTVDQGDYVEYKDLI